MILRTSKSTTKNCGLLPTLVLAFSLALGVFVQPSTSVTSPAEAMLQSVELPVTGECRPPKRESSRRRLADLNPSSPFYYNQLRQDATEFYGPEDTNSTSRVFKVAVPNSNKVIRLVELKSFVPFSYEGTEMYLQLGEGVVPLLAMYHFNNIELSPILNETHVSACKDLKLTMTLFDSMFSPIESVRLFTEMIQTPKTFKNKPAAGVLGEYRSAASLALGILTGINHLPEISPASGANDFENKDQYPLFGRTIPPNTAMAQVSARFFEGIGSSHVAILYVTDTNGPSLQKDFVYFAHAAGISTISIPLPYDVAAGSPEIVQAIEMLKQSHYQHVFAILYANELKAAVEEATKEGVIGPGFLYLCPMVSFYEFDGMGIDAANSAIVNSFNGLAVVGSVEGLDDTRVFAELNPGTQLYFTFNKFLDSVTKASSNPEFLQFVRESIPESVYGVPGFDISQGIDDMGSNGLLFYDAVTALALAMCNTPNDFFTGEEVYKEFLQSDFFGASGPVRFDNHTGSRLYESKYWGVWGMQYNTTQPDGNASFSATPAFQLVGGKWVSIPGQSFIYADGSTVPPDCVPPAAYEYNYIGPTARIVGYTFMCITMLSAILSVLWLHHYRDLYIVMSAKPLFLLLISFGTFTMAATIIPLGLEETVVDDVDGLNKACMSIPWVYILGFTCTTSALLAKIRRVHTAYASPDLEIVDVVQRDFLMALGSLLFVNLIVLVCWTAIAPLHWTREPGEKTDEFDRVIDSYGRCVGHDDEVFAIILAVFNLGVLAIATWWAYKSRNIETEFDESSYMSLSVAAVLQAWSVGIPILIVASENPLAKFYVACSIIFITSQSVLSLVYIPKVIVLYRLVKAGVSKENLKKLNDQVSAEVQSSSLFFSESYEKADKHEEPSLAMIPEIEIRNAKVPVERENSMPQYMPLAQTETQSETFSTQLDKMDAEGSSALEGDVPSDLSSFHQDASDLLTAGVVSLPRVMEVDDV